MSLTVAISGQGSVTVTGLPVGSYTVTELTGWSWRYEPDRASAAVVLQPGKDNTVTFMNEKTNLYWLDGDSCKDNIFDTKG